MEKSKWSVLALVGLLLLATASAAVAEEMSSWVGRDVDNDRVHWSCTNSFGDNWSLKRGGTYLGTFETVARTSEYTELRSRSGSDLVRLYKDRLCLNKDGSRFNFVTMAKGRWH